MSNCFAIQDTLLKRELLRSCRTLLTALLAVVAMMSTCVSISAQLPLHFVHYTENTGLSHYQAWSMFQDSRGLYWIGTTDGLNRFDGGRFTNYFHQDNQPQSLCGNVVVGVLENSKHDILVGTTDGISVFHAHNNSFSTVFQSAPSATQDNIIQHIAADPLENIWVVYRHQVVILNAAFQPIKTLQLSTQLDKDIYRAQADAAGQMWLNVGRAMMCIDPNNNFHIIDASNNSHQLFQVEVADFDFDSSGNIVTADPNTGMLRTFNTAGELILESSLPENKPLPCVRLFTTPSGKHWVVSRDRGVYCYLGGQWVHRAIAHNPNLPASICSDQVKSIVEDSYGNTWFCCDAGLDVVFENALDIQFSFRENDPKFDSQHPMQINAAYSDSNYTWLATWGRGLGRVQRTTGASAYFSPGNDPDNLFMNDVKRVGKDLWVGNFSGFFRFDAAAGAFHAPSFANSPNDAHHRYPIFHIEETRAGSLFLSSNENKGLLIYPRNTAQAEYYSQDSSGIKNFPFRHFSAMAELADGRIIFGYNRSNGLVNYDASTKRFAMISEHDPLSFPEQVNCLMSRDSFLWIGNNHGLHRIHIASGQRVSITRQDGLPVNIVNAITSDAQGTIWVGTRKGISRLNPKTLGIVNYSLNAIDTDENVTGIAYNNRLACLEAFTDHVYFQFLTESEELTILHAPEIIACSLGNQYLPLDAQARLDLSENDRTLIVEFLCPVNPALANIHFQYQLKGFDTEWISADDSRRIHYSSLPAGNFQLSIRASVDGVQWLEMAQPLVIHVRPLFYKRLGFIISAGIIVILMVLFTVQRRKRIRLKNLLAIQEVRNRIAADLHDDIGSTLSSISILSEVALHKLPTEPSKTGNMLTKIGEQSRTLISEMSDMVWSIHPENDNFESIGLRMRDYAATMVRERDIQCDLIIPENEQWPKIDMRTRRNLFLIYKEAIHNVIKHAQCSMLTIRIRIVEQAVSMTISDNGIGFSMDTSKAGNGLKNMQKRAEQIGAELSIRTSAGQGTTLKLKTKKATNE